MDYFAPDQQVVIEDNRANWVKLVAVSGVSVWLPANYRKLIHLSGDFRLLPQKIAKVQHLA